MADDTVHSENADRLLNSSSYLHGGARLIEREVVSFFKVKVLMGVFSFGLGCRVFVRTFGGG